MNGKTPPLSRLYAHPDSFAAVIAIVVSRLRTLPLLVQFLSCIGVVVALSLACFLLRDLIGYRVTALLLLMGVSALAMLFGIGPVLTAAALSALVWNYFFIPPVFTFHIGSAEDVLMFLLYFVIASVNAVLTLKIRQAERRARDKEEQERSIALYHTLFNSLSHELRTPIATILGAVDALGDPARLTPAQRTELLTEIGTAGERLDRQVGDLLSMSRLESGLLQPKRDWCDVNELIGAQVQKLEGSDTHRLDFRPDPALPLFKLDGGMLREVLGNLLHNALHHTPHATVVTIGVTHRAEACVITVSDNGPGFPAEEIPLAFDKFHRLPQARPGGSGLGLSIVKGFVEAQGGTVHLGAAEPSGAVFTVTIPAETSFLSNLKHE